MAINFPTSLDSLTNPTSTDLMENAVAALDHDVQHSNANDAIEALEAKVGINGSAVTTTHDYKLSAVTSTAKALTSGTSTQSVTGLTLVSPTLTLTSDATGDMYYRNSGGALTRLPIGSAGQIIQVSSGGIPEYIANPAATDASTTVKGVVEEATQAEVNAGTAAGGTSARLFVNPSTLSTWLSTQNTSFLSVASGENISANKPVYINPLDSSVYTAHGFKELDSTALNLTASTTEKISKLSDTQMMFLTHSGATLTITVYDINSASSVASQTVTTAFDTSGVSVTLTGATACRLSDTTFIVFYAKTTDSALYFRTGSISGGTITMDTETAYSGSPTYCFGLDSQPGASNGKVILIYQKSTADPGSSATVTPTLAYLTCSTNTATVTYSTTLTDFTSAAYFATPVWSVAQFTRGIAYGLFCVSNSSGVRIIQYAYIDVNSGATDTDKQIPRLGLASGGGTSDNYSQFRPYFAGHNGYGYFGYTVINTTGDVYTQSIIKIGTSGAVIEYQSTATEGALSPSTTLISLVGNEMGVIASNFLSINYSTPFNTLYIQKDKIIPFYSLDELYGSSAAGNGRVIENSAWYSNSKDEIVGAFIDASNGVIKQWRLPTPVDGFVTSSVTAPASATIYNSTATTSGLTANAQYYLKDTYTTVGDTDFIGTIPFGDALSSTVLKLK